MLRLHQSMHLVRHPSFINAELLSQYLDASTLPVCGIPVLLADVCVSCSAADRGPLLGVPWFCMMTACMQLYISTQHVDWAAAASNA